MRCILDTDHNPLKISLAENVIRSAPTSSKRLLDCTMREAWWRNIAARFGVTAALVKQRLKLGAVSPRLMQAYRDEELTLEELTPFATTDDHARQEQVWDELPDCNRSREVILRALSEGQVSSDDRRAAFIGAEAYQATLSPTIAGDQRFDVSSLASHPPASPNSGMLHHDLQLFAQAAAALVDNVSAPHQPPEVHSPLDADHHGLMDDLPKSHAWHL